MIVCLHEEATHLTTLFSVQLPILFLFGVQEEGVGHSVILYYPPQARLFEPNVGFRRLELKSS